MTRKVVNQVASGPMGRPALTLCLGEPVLLDKYCQVCTSEDKETPEAAARPSTNLVESPRGSSRSGA